MVERVLIAGDAKHVLTVSPWTQSVLESPTREVRVRPGPARIEDWSGELGKDLGPGRQPADVCIFILGGAHAGDAVLPSLAPIVMMARRSGCRLVWAAPPGFEQAHPDKARELESAVQTAGETFVSTARVPMLLSGQVMAPPCAKRYLAVIGKALPESGDTSDLSDRFFELGDAMAKRIGIDFVHLLLAMNVESGVRGNAENPSSHAVGLIQFATKGKPSTLEGVGWGGSKDDFKMLSAEEQLPYVETFFKPYAGKNLSSAARIYQALLVPATLDESGGDTILSETGTRQWGTPPNVEKEADLYRANKALDPNGAGAITTSSVTNILLGAAKSARFKAILGRYSAVTGRALPGVMPIDAPHKAAPIGPILAGVTLVGSVVSILGYLESRGARQKRVSRRVPA
jgi:hypothetical protein